MKSHSLQFLQLRHLLGTSVPTASAVRKSRGLKLRASMYDTVQALLSRSPITKMSLWEPATMYPVPNLLVNTASLSTSSSCTGSKSALPSPTSKSTGPSGGSMFSMVRSLNSPTTSSSPYTLTSVVIRCRPKAQTSFLLPSLSSRGTTKILVTKVSFFSPATVSSRRQLVPTRPALSA